MTKELANAHAIIDGYGLIYRAYFAFINSPLINPAGQNISSLYGFIRILLKFIKDWKPLSVTIAMDSARPTFRHKIFPEYKAHREKMPSDLYSQLPILKEFFQKANIPTLDYPEMEADDIMGTLSEKWQKFPNPILLFTGDKDAYQLINSKVFILAPLKGISDLTVYDETRVEEKLNVTTSQIIDYMALVGDTSDNVPGVKGIGPKSARDLLAKFETLDKIYEGLAAISSKGILEKLNKGKDDAYMSRELVTIKKDLQLEIEPRELSLEEIFSEEVAGFLEKNGIPSMAREIREKGAGGSPEGLSLSPEPEGKKRQRNYQLIIDLDSFSRIFEKLNKHEGLIAVDTETTSSHPMEAELIGFSISIREGEAFYFHLKKPELISEGLDWNTISGQLDELLNNKNVKIVAQNYKYDYLILKRHGLNPPPVYLDTMIASYLLAPGERRHNLDSLAQAYLGEIMISYNDLTGKGKNRIPITEVPPQKLAEYAAEDADMTLRLAIILEERLRDEKLWKLFHQMEKPLIFILSDMEMAGVAIDAEYFKKLSIKMSREIQALEKNIHDSAGRIFNVNSTQELQKTLFEDLALPKIKKTKTGYSTDVSVLEALLGKHPIIQYILDYRVYSKLRGTYVDALPKMINSSTGRIHSSFNQTVAATGRLSSSNPNLQNIPIKDETGRAIRKGFITAKGHRLMSCDYSQIELRIVAHLSEDQTLLDAFANKADIHAITANQIFGFDINEVTPEQRRVGKTVNFGIIYGQTPFGLSRQLGIPQKDAKAYIEGYFLRYPGVKKYMNSVIEFGKKNGYVETLYGRKRKVLGLEDQNRIRRQAAERIAINAPVQGTAADIIKMAMVEIDKKLKKNGYKAKMILQVHDELLFEVNEKEEHEILELVQSTMENIKKLKVPLVVNAFFGDNWEEAH